MTVTTSYPGVYIEELPSLVHSIQAAPTSIAVFVGYTHPFLTTAVDPDDPTKSGPATLLFSFADYQKNFGGFFSSPWLPDYVGQAVYQFFLNGGQQCYVVGLPSVNYETGGGTEAVVGATAEIMAGSSHANFTALQPVGIPPDTSVTPHEPAVGIPMTITASNLTGGGLIDLVISYGSTVETYRRVAFGDLTKALAASRLAKVTVSGTGPWDSTSPGQQSFAYASGSVPDEEWTVVNTADFAQVFEDNASLDKVPVFNLLLTPGVTDNVVASEAVAYAERKRAFYIMDTPSSSTSTTGPGSSHPTISWKVDDLTGNVATALQEWAVPVSINAGLYYPWLQTTDPITGNTTLSPPSGFVAGMFSQEDNRQGVWKSPAGIETSLLGTLGVDQNGVMTDLQQGQLNKNAVNCVRQFAGAGTVIFGARTTAGADTNTAQQQWKYVAVRRMALFIEQSLYQSLTWAVFQGNSQPLWDALAAETRAFMLSLFRQGAFAGTTPSQAFLVQCDSTTTTPTDVANGVVNLLVGFAPLVPAEFVVIQIAQLAGQAQS